MWSFIVGTHFLATWSRSLYFTIPLRGKLVLVLVILLCIERSLSSSLASLILILLAGWLIPGELYQYYWCWFCKYIYFLDLNITVAETLIDLGALFPSNFVDRKYVLWSKMERLWSCKLWVYSYLWLFLHICGQSYLFFMSCICM
jgi:hypothetical protein